MQYTYTGSKQMKQQKTSLPSPQNALFRYFTKLKLDDKLISYLKKPLYPVLLAVAEMVSKHITYNTCLLDYFIQYFHQTLSFRYILQSQR